MNLYSLIKQKTKNENIKKLSIIIDLVIVIGIL